MCEVLTWINGIFFFSIVVNYSGQRPGIALVDLYLPMECLNSVSKVLDPVIRMGSSSRHIDTPQTARVFQVRYPYDGLALTWIVSLIGGWLETDNLTWKRLLNTARKQWADWVHHSSQIGELCLWIMFWLKTDESSFPIASDKRKRCALQLFPQIQI